ncbi:MAG: dihydrodipicolinate synthase family protein [Planctomycetota bacterium]|nr:dihydrodipicolinate synthase family protein [Planctomycetota bacterium]
MQISRSSPIWRGIFPPMVTPLRDRDTLDVAGLECLIEHILAGGVHGLFILGTTGEAPSLSYQLRRELIKRVCRQVRERVPVLVGITDTAFVESLNLARRAAEAGAQAVVLAPPYYFPSGQPELFEYVQHLTEELPLPLFLYNMPLMTKVVFEPQTIRRLLDNPRICGVKDSSGDLAYFDQLLALARERPDWTVLIGPEHLLADAVRRGGQGGVNGGANLHPRLFVELYDAASRRDTTRVAELQDQVLRLGRIYQVGRHASAIIKGLKCALSLLGLCDDFMAEPFQRFREPERGQVRQLLDELGL